MENSEQHGISYVITYDEDQWFQYSPERQEQCKADWMKRANAMPNIRVVCLRLVPDPLFPRSEQSKPYIAWQQDTDRTTRKNGKVSFVQLREAYHQFIKTRDNFDDFIEVVGRYVQPPS